MRLKSLSDEARGELRVKAFDLLELASSIVEAADPALDMDTNQDFSLEYAIGALLEVGVCSPHLALVGFVHIGRAVADAAERHDAALALECFGIGVSSVLVPEGGH